MSAERNAGHRNRPATGLLFAFLLIMFAYFVPRGIQANADSHLALVYSLVEHQSVRIDRYAPFLIDKAASCGTGTSTCHYYSDKAPGLSMYVAAIYLPLHFVLPSAMMPADPSADRFLLRYLLTLLALSIPCAAFAIVFLRFMTGFVDWRAAAIAAAGFALGSMALPFSMLLFSHVLTAALLFGAFILLFKCRTPESGRWQIPVLAGIMAGFAIACEYPAAIIAGLLALYAVISARSLGARARTVGLYAAGLIIGVAPALTYNAIAFGSPFALGYAHLTDPYYSAGMANGLLGVSWPTWNAAWGTSFSPFRGMFVLSPWLLLALPGLYRMRRRGLRLEAALCAVVVVCYFMFQAGYAFWDGGASVGPRHFLPALPFLVFPVAFALQSRTLWRAGAILVVYSAVVLLLVVATNPLFGDPHYVAGVRDPLIDQTLHDVATGVWQNNWANILGLHGVLSLLPLLLIEAWLGRKIAWRLGAETGRTVAGCAATASDAAPASSAANDASPNL